MQERLMVLLCSFILLMGCTHETEPPASIHQEIPDASSSVRYAQGFRVSEEKGTSCLTLYDLEQEDRQVRCIICEGAARNSSDTLWIERTNTAVTTLSTTHLAFFWRLGLLDHVKGTAYASWVKNEEVAQRLASKTMENISGDQEIDLERMISIAPDVLISYPYGDDSYERIAGLGVTVIPFSEYLETHPLGRAEWIKAAAWIVDEEAMADRVFNEITKAYEQSAALVQFIDPNERPLVFTGSQDQGQWFAPSGKSFIARFIEDAGGRYLFEDHQEKGNIHLDMEVLLTRAMEADFLGKVSYRNHELTYDDLKNEDQRLAHLPAFQHHHVFYCNAEQSDYFGDAIVEPEIILRDLIAILHPELLPEYEAEYFQPLTK